MSTAESTLSPLFWRNLLALLDERRVVPIIGPDAVIVDGDRGPRPYYDYVAARVERELDLEPSADPELNDVACRYLLRAGSQQLENLYIAVRLALDEERVEPPDGLRKLARIPAFKLFVTTTFDDLLRNAVDQERYGGKRTARYFAYSPGRVDDLPEPLSSFSEPVVYHLLGRASAAPEYVVTEEDTLEFVHALQSEERRPRRLLEELMPRSLLIIGSGYSDWLARFFLRVAKCERLLLARSKTDVVAEETGGDAAPLGTFLRHFSAQTKIYPRGALAFIDELSERWEEHAAEQPRDSPAEPARPAILEHAIFISYAHDDEAAAGALAGALERAGLPVWLDRSGGLKGGEDWNEKIRRQIETASFFVPLLTPHVLTSSRRYFRVEWSIAAEVAPTAPETLPFVVPVRMGEVAPEERNIDRTIRGAHWLTAKEGEGGFDAVVARLQELYREYRLTLEGTG